MSDDVKPVAWVHPFYLEAGTVMIECSPWQLNSAQVPLYPESALLAQQEEIARLKALAEAMAVADDYQSGDGTNDAEGRLAKAIAAYRAAYPKGPTK